MKQLIILIALTVFTTATIFAQSSKNAPWVSYLSANQTAYGVYYFRKSFDLEKVPEKLVIHVSADNRYNLFVNGQRVYYVPANGKCLNCNFLRHI